MPGRAAFVFVAILGALSCGPATGSQRPRRSLISDGDFGPVGASTSATWIIHPTADTEARARMPLAGGAELAVGEGGERWVSQPDGRMEAASAAAPEGLIAVGKAARGYAFVGASGRVYLTAEPLGAFLEVREPPEPFVSVAASEGRLVGVQAEGTLWTASDWGARWERASAPARWFTQVALAADGTGLALAVPEEWWRSDDRGRSWQRTSLPPVGARELVTRAEGAIEVTGLFGSYRLVEGAWRAVGPASSRPVSSGLALSGRSEGKPAEAEPGPVADAARVLAGTAVVDGGEYFGLEGTGADGARTWRVVRGTLGTRLTASDARGLPGTCGAVLVSKRGAHVAVLCGASRAGQSSAPFTLWLSRDAGESFERSKIDVRGDFSRARLAVGRDGAILLSGICAPHLSGPGCAPRGVYSLPPGAKRLTPLALPGLHGAEALAFGMADQVYVVGPREKDHRLTLYASVDGGRTFAVRDLEIGVVNSERRGTAGRPPVTLVVDVDGAVSVSARQRGRLFLVALDADGQVVARGQAPASAREAAGAGLRALALEPETRSLWESLDGGSSWELIPLPRPLCRLPAPNVRQDECEVALACSAAGCVVGKSLSRIGWGSTDVSAPLPVSQGVSQRVAEGRRTPISCTLRSEPWQPIEGLATVPAAPDAAVGSAHWFAFAADYETGAVWALHALEGRRSIERRELFPPVTEPTHYALAVLDQVEGSAALRYRVPFSSRQERDITGVEVAWDNRFEDVIGRARIEGNFRPQAGDYHSRSARTLAAEPALLSVSGRGVFVRLHASLEDAQTTYYVDGRVVQKLPPIRWPASVVARRTEMIRLGERPVPLAFHGDGQWVAFASLDPSAPPSSEGAKPSFSAHLVGIPDPRALGLGQSVSLAFTGTTPGLAVVQARATGTWWRAYTVPFGGPEGSVLGNPVPAPLLPDLSDPPVPCDAATRRSSARVVAPAFPGAPHPVLLNDSVDAPRLLFTGRGVLHGAPESPCVAAFEATESRAASRAGSDAPGTYGSGNGEERRSALLPMNDLAHAWAFREVSENRWGQKRIFARSMSCRMDPAAVIPRELLHEGTL